MRDQREGCEPRHDGRGRHPDEAHARQHAEQAVDLVREPEERAEGARCARPGLHPEPPLHEAVRQLADDVPAAQSHAPEDRMDAVEVHQRRRARPAVAMEEAGLREGETSSSRPPW